MRKNFIIYTLFTFIFLGNTSSTTNKGVWRILGKVTYYKKYNPDLKARIDYPKFSPEVKNLNGKTITITGYIVPLELYGFGDYVVISRYPASQCYFCGGAGLETVIEVYPISKRRTFHFDRVTFKGKLKLNSKDPAHLMYLLKDAKQVFAKK